jgi:hypothetical protein
MMRAHERREVGDRRGLAYEPFPDDCVIADQLQILGRKRTGTVQEPYRNGAFSDVVQPAYLIAAVDVTCGQAHRSGDPRRPRSDGKAMPIGWVVVLPELLEQRRGRDIEFGVHAAVRALIASKRPS